LIEPIGPHLDDLQEFHAFMLRTQTVNAVLLAIAQLSLLDHLDDGPATAEEVAASGGLNASNTARVLRFLAAQQIIGCDDAHRYSHTSRSRLFQQQQSSVQFLRESMGAAQGMAECLKTGVPAFDCRFGQPVFDYLTEHADARNYFGDLMSRTTAVAEAFVFGQHRFEPFELAVDVGGSHGRLLIELLRRHPEARGIVFDLPETAAQAASIITKSQVSGRIEASGGDFFEAVPAGGDLYLLKQILHDWNDDECIRILSSIRRAIADNGRLAIIEFFLPDKPENNLGFAMDIQMLALSTGRERTAAELEALLAASRFRLDRVSENPGGPSVVEAVPA